MFLHLYQPEQRQHGYFFSFLASESCQVTLIGLIRRVLGDDLFSSKGLGAASVSSRSGATFLEMDCAAFDVAVWESENPCCRLTDMA